MPASLINTNISETYVGLLHADGQSLPSSGLIAIKDGSGVESSLQIGVSGQGMTVTGAVVLDELTVPTIITNTTTSVSGAVAPNIPKAWVSFAGSDATIRAAFGVGSVARSSTGVYVIQLTPAMLSTNYAVQLSVMYNNTDYILTQHVDSSPAPTTEYFTVKTYRATATGAAVAYDPTTVGVVLYHL